MNNDYYYGDGQDYERLKSTEKEPQGEYADIWDEAMKNGVPEFNEGRPWGFDEDESADGLIMEELQPGELGNLTEMANFAGESDDNVIENNEIDNAEICGDFIQASKAVSYGLDTASRVYGLDMVLAAIQNIDEAGRDAENPLGAIYERLAPTTEAQEHLYGEMKRDLEKPQRAAFSLPATENTLRVGRNARGEFFEKNPEDGWPEQNHEASIQMIQALKKIIEALDKDERFAKVREKAQVAGLTPLEYLVREEINPTLSYFLNRAGETTEIEIEELLTETAEKAEQETLNTDVADGKIMKANNEEESHTDILETQDELPEVELGEIQDLGLPETHNDANKRDFRELEELSSEMINKDGLEDNIDVDEWFEKSGREI